MNHNLAVLKSQKVANPQKKLKVSLRKLFVSPYGATIFPISVLIIAFLFPPDLYQYYVNEYDYMFLDFRLIFFVLTCSIFYYIGIHISNFKFPYKINLFKNAKKIGLDYFKYVGVIAFVSIFLEVIFLVVRGS